MTATGSVLYLSCTDGLITGPDHSTQLLSFILLLLNPLGSQSEAVELSLMNCIITRIYTHPHRPELLHADSCKGLPLKPANPPQGVCTLGTYLQPVFTQELKRTLTQIFYLTSNTFHHSVNSKVSSLRLCVNTVYIHLYTHTDQLQQSDQ